MLIAQITDMHIKAGRKLSYRVVDTASMLERCVAAILALKQRPDVVVMTGDLVDFGDPQEYAVLREIIAPLAMPIYLIPGNHDERAALRAAFPEHAYLRAGGEFVQYAIEDHPVRIVGLDTVIPGKGAGELCSARLDWLARTLERERAKPTVVLMHHPPFATGIGHMDKIGLAGSDHLATVLRAHPQVERVLCGHLHRAIHTRFGGTIGSTCPSPAHQVALDIDPAAPSRFMMEPPGFQLHWWNASAGLVTHTAPIGEFAGPYPFFENGKLID